jgi:hypothetical protein
MNQSHQLFAEVFPVQTATMPKLHAYKLDIQRGDWATIGGKLAYRLRRAYGGQWIWTRDGDRLITDTPQAVEQIQTIVEALWSEHPDVFGGLHGVLFDPVWYARPQAVADIVARSFFDIVHPQIMQILARRGADLGAVRVERVYDRRGWVMQTKPAISLSISSRLIAKQDVSAELRHLHNPDDLIGTWVADKTSTFKGEVVAITGRVRDHRARLLKLTQREDMAAIIEQSADEDWVLVVGKQRYEYVASALNIIVRMGDLARFRINGPQAIKALRISPQARTDIVKEIASLAKSYGLIENAYSAQRAPHLFLTRDDVDDIPALRLGNGQVYQGDPQGLMQALRRHGVYRRATHMAQPNATLRIVRIVSTVAALRADFWDQLAVQLKNLAFNVEYVGDEVVNATTRGTFEHALDTLQHHNPHLVVLVLPDTGLADEDDDLADSPYHQFKSLTVGRGLPSQVVFEETLNKPFALANIVLGVLSKTGNTPFVLAQPLPYADLVVGIDIARRRKVRLAGSINATAIARIYTNDGDFLRYTIHDAPLEGETIPDSVLQGLFPLQEFRGKRVIIQRDGYFRGGEKRALQNWAITIGATFHLVEVIKSGTPRMYLSQPQPGGQPPIIGQPPKGSALKVSNTEAFLVSSPPPFKDATPQPLHLRTEASFPIEQAIHSVLTLTQLHYGSVRPPRLPVTIHYSDKIAGLAINGIKPKDLEGNVPFWL